MSWLIVKNRQGQEINRKDKPKHKDVIEYKVNLKAHKFKYESNPRKKF